MAIADIVLKARANMALAREPGIHSSDMTLSCKSGELAVHGDCDSEETRAHIVTVLRNVEGVSRVEDHITVGTKVRAETADLLTLELLEKLDEEWERLPDDHALTQADYLRWSLWLIYKFHLPASIAGADKAALEADTVNRAIEALAERFGVSAAVIAVEMLRLVEESHGSAPVLSHSGLSSSSAGPGAGV